MKKLLATLLILCAGPVWAEWVEYAKTEAGNRHYFDPSTVKGGNIKRAWDKTEFKEPVKGPQGNANSFRTYYEYDCVNEKVKILQLEAFSETNLAGKSLLYRSSEPRNWEYVPPRTIQKTLFDKVCGRK